MWPHAVGSGRHCCQGIRSHGYYAHVQYPAGVNRAVACIEVGLRCDFVARGRRPEEVVARFWHHARARHSHELTTCSANTKESLHELVEALSTSRRHPHHRRADLSPELRELVASGDVRRWWC